MAGHPIGRHSRAYPKDPMNGVCRDACRVSLSKTLPFVASRRQWMVVCVCAVQGRVVLRQLLKGPALRRFATAMNGRVCCDPLFHLRL